jgi:hypothetical protein
MEVEVTGVEVAVLRWAVGDLGARRRMLTRAEVQTLADDLRAALDDPNLWMGDRDYWSGALVALEVVLAGSPVAIDRAEASG